MNAQIGTGLRFLFLSFLCQAIAFGAGVSLREYPLAALIAHSTTAFLAARLVSLPFSWQIINALLPLGVVLTLTHQEFYPLLTIATGVGILIYLPTFWTRVPFYPTNTNLYEVLEDNLPKDACFTFLDIGSGFGTVVMRIARHYPKGQFTGVEISPLAVVLSKVRCLFSRNVTIKAQSFWSEDLSQYDFVYAFLSPIPMPELWKKVQREMKAGSLFLVNTFRVEEKPDEIFEIPGTHQILYGYRIKEKNL